MTIMLMCLKGRIRNGMAIIGVSVYHYHTITHEMVVPVGHLVVM